MAVHRAVIALGVLLFTQAGVLAQDGPTNVPEPTGWDLYLRAFELYQPPPDAWESADYARAYTAGDEAELARLTPEIEAYLRANDECLALLHEAALLGGRPPASDGPDVDAWTAAIGAIERRGPATAGPWADLRGPLGELGRKLQNLATGDASRITDPGIGFPVLAKMREFARLEAASAVYEHAHGRGDEAFERVRDGMALGWSLTHGMFAEWLAGAAVVSIVGGAQRAILKGGADFDVGTLLAQADALAESRAEAGALSEVAAHEANYWTSYWCAARDYAALSRTDHAPEGSTPATDAELAFLNEASEWALRAYALVVEEAAKPPWEMDADGVLARIAEAPVPTLPDDEDETGFADLVWFGPKAVSAYAQRLNQWLGTEWTLRIEAYRVATGDYPAEPGDLVPEFGAALPVDAWTGEPLLYRRTEGGYVLYGAGPNRTDDGGVGEPGRGIEPDQVLASVGGGPHGAE